MYTVVDLYLDARTQGGGTTIQRTALVGGVPWDPTTADAQLESLKDLGRTRSTHLSGTDLALIRHLLLPETQWTQLGHLAALESTSSRGVRLALHTSEDLHEIPWEAAVLGEPSTREISVVRQVGARDENIVESAAPVVRFIHAVTKAENDDANGALRKLRRALKQTLDAEDLPNWTPGIDAELKHGIDQMDLLHFTGHGAERGEGLRVLAKQRSKDRNTLDSFKVAQLVEVCGARVVVLAACDAASQPWSLAARILAVPRVCAVVAMREAVTGLDVATFCIAMYDELVKGASLDEAVTAGRRRLFGTETWVPQLYLNVTGDTRLWRSRTSEQPVLPDPVPPTAVRPLPVVRWREQLWQVKCNAVGRMAIYRVDSGGLDVTDAHCSVVVSPDARAAASISGNHLDLAWLTPSSVGPRLEHLANGGLDLPTDLGAGRARVLALAVVGGARLRLLISTDDRTCWVFLGHGPSGSAQWGPVQTVANRSAGSAIDTLPVPALLIDDEIDDSYAQGPIFDGSPAATMVDCGWSGGRRVAAAATIAGANGTIRVATGDGSSHWLPLAQFTTGTRGIAVVRSMETPWSSTMLYPVEIVNVDIEGNVQLVALDPAVPGAAPRG